MGFYQPAQLLEQAKRQHVEIHPVDVTVSDYDCTLETSGDETPGIRLGMRLVKGLRKEEAERIVAARKARPFESVADVAHRAALPARTIKLLALAGALRGITEDRNQAFWQALGAERLPGMLSGNSAQEPRVALPRASEWEEVLRDYRHLGLSTGRHPLALLRARLRAHGISSRREIASMRHGSKVQVSGLVTHLQHPQTANGVIFGSLEDETGINNVIFWPKTFAAYRHKILGANLMLVKGELQREGSVIHVVAEEVDDLSAWVRALPRNSRDFH